jgi:serine/threonine protein kinase
VDLDYIRRCPTCDAENPPQMMRCACGALLAGVDLSQRNPEPASCFAEGGTPTDNHSECKNEVRQTSDAVICPHDDCAQSNPAGSSICLYCNRPISHVTSLTKPGQLQSLLTLPGRLRERYRILQPLPTQGAEAELLLVEEHGGGPIRVAKIYRHGIQPRPEVQERIARVDAAHRVEILESGISEGYAFELMEYCVLGSLRERMRSGPLSSALLHELVHELSIAIAGVHEVGLLHRDLKPENILVRTEHPLDLVLTDFGTSSMLDATQRFTGTARTLPYASPESLSGVIDGKADYWSLGMILLEALLGRHPFVGLSEAVILHHLATKSVDLSAIVDRKFRTLLRGLLLRDPKQRWGIDEITRWRADDSSLAEPNEQGTGINFNEPYHVGKEICHTNEQLAVALARNWREGIADITNGQLQSWFRDVQKDQNCVRILLELRYERNMPVDVQLLKLILYLAPGIPPVWRGETIELPAILSHANLALKGDGEAAQWLDKLYQYRVLETYAAVGNREADSIVQKWGSACDQFAHAWNAGLALIKAKAPARSADEYVNYDQLLYGNGGPASPAMSTMHARLLAMAYDAQWSERLRKRLTADLTGLMVYCPWFAELGDTQTMSPSSLLVLESLLPEARNVADRQIKANDRQRESESNDCKATKQDVSAVISAIRTAARSNMMIATGPDNLRTELDRYFDLLAGIKASGRSDLEWQAVKKSVVRSEKVAAQLQLLIDTLTEWRAINAGWMSAPVLGFAALAMIFLPIFFSRAAIYFLWGAIGAVIAWRIVSTYSITRRIKEVAARLPS